MTQRLYKLRRIIACTAAPLLSIVSCGCPLTPPPSQQQQRQKVASRWICIEVADDNPDVVSRGAGLDRRDAQRIKATVPTIVTLVVERVGAGTAVRGQMEAEIRISGTAPDYFQLLSDAGKAEVKRGRFLTDADARNKADVIVIDLALAEKLFGSDRPVGQTIRIGTADFTIAGVVAVPRQSMLGDVMRDAYFPVHAFDPDRLRLDEHSGAELDRIWCEVATLDQVSATREMIENLIGQNHPDGRVSVR